MKYKQTENKLSIDVSWDHYIPLEEIEKVEKEGWTYAGEPTAHILFVAGNTSNNCGFKRYQFTRT